MSPRVTGEWATSSPTSSRNCRARSTRWFTALAKTRPHWRAQTKPEASTTESAHGEEAVLVVESASARETKAWGRRLGSLLAGGELLGLSGELGAGKTCFIKGVARGLGLREEDIVSPSFTMIQEHHGRLPLYHIDLYRLKAPGLDDLGLREYLFSSGVAAVEWLERLREAAELDCLWVRINRASANVRRLEFRASGERHAPIVAKLRSRFA